MLRGDYPTSIDERGVECTPKSPDIVVIDRARPYEWNSSRTKRAADRAARLGKEYNPPSGLLKIIEVTYGWDPNWEAKVAAKTTKYGPLVAELELSGWKVEFMVIVVGVTGMSRCFFSEEQRKGLGISRVQSRTLETKVSRSSWGYVRSIWVARCIAVAVIEAGAEAGGAGPDEHT